jgi:hypothetical protein
VSAPHSRRCAACHRSIDHLAADADYCRGACRQKAHRARQKAARSWLSVEEVAALRRRHGVAIGLIERNDIHTLDPADRLALLAAVVWPSDDLLRLEEEDRLSA